MWARFFHCYHIIFFTCYVLHLTLFSLVSVWIFSYEFQTNCKQYYSQNYIKKIKKHTKNIFHTKNKLVNNFVLEKQINFIFIVLKIFRDPKTYCKKYYTQSFITKFQKCLSEKLFLMFKSN